MCEQELKLLPCPFCGGDAETAISLYTAEDAKEEGWAQTEFHVVICQKCEAMTKDNPRYSSRAEAISAWNNRITTHV